MMTLVVRADGQVRCIYDEAIDLAAIGIVRITRASHVEPDGAGRWWADLSPVGGPPLGPFDRRGQALEAERSWLDANLQQTGAPSPPLTFPNSKGEQIMKKKLVTHLVIDTSSSNEHYNGDCDFALVPLTADYMTQVLGYMNQVAAMHKADQSVYCLECWDYSASYFRSNEKLDQIRDIHGQRASEVPRGEPILLTADPRFNEGDFQRVDCQTVGISCNEAWWTAYVKNTNVRIETAHVSKACLEKVLKRFPRGKQRPAVVSFQPADPVARRIHDLLYLDIKDGREFYNPDKTWDADVLTMIAEVIAQHIPRPKKEDDHG